MSIITIQERITDQAKCDAAAFINKALNILQSSLPVSFVPAKGLLTLKAAIESQQGRSLNLDYVLREIRDAILPEVQTVFINKASKEFLEKVNAVQTQLEEIQSQLP